ncbi:hypothetical protein ES702_04251 [subsurface metagenome]
MKNLEKIDIEFDLKNFAELIGGAVIAVPIDRKLGDLWAEAGLPMIGIGPLHLDDLLLLLFEGAGAYLAISKGYKDIATILLGMFCSTVALETYEALVDYGFITPYHILA